MLKHIYIHIGHLGAIFPIRQFCKQHSDFLKQNNLHRIEFKQLFPERQNINFNEFMYGDTWIIGDTVNKRDSLELPPFSSVLDRLQEYIRKQQIENLLITLSLNDLEFCLPELFLLRKTFAGTQFHIQEHTVDLVRDSNCTANLKMLFAKAKAYPINFHTFISSVNLLDNNYRQQNPCIASLSKLFNVSISQSVFKHETDVFHSWLEFVHLSLPQTINFLPQATFSPRVISYLIALFDHFTQKQGISFAEETDFLYSFSEPSKLFSYHSPYQADDIHDVFPVKQECQEKICLSYTDCSHMPLRIDRDTAQILSSKLSEAMRAKLTDGITPENLEYTDNTNKIVYASLMTANKKISEEQAAELIRKRPGRITCGETGYTEKPIVTILTLTYNHEKYIAQCVESILKQKTKYPYRHILIDSNSSDNTPNLIKEYAQKYPHIETVLKPYNISDINYYSIINNIDTKYLAVCDGDDFYTDENKLQEQIDFLENNPDSQVCFSSVYIYFENKHAVTAIYPICEQDFKEKTFYRSNDIILKNLIQSSSVTYRWLLPNGIIPHYPLCLRPFDWSTNIFHSYNSKIGFINKPMSLYRRHAQALYASSENNIQAHVVTRIFWELFFCHNLDLMTEKKLTKLFNQKAIMLLSTFYFSDGKNDVDPERYKTLKNRIEKCFPYYIKLFYAFIQENMTE